MSPTAPRPTRLPRAGIDPIDDVRTAVALIKTAVTWPLRPETIVVLLDSERCGIGLVVVSDTDDHDDVLEVARRILDPQVHEGRAAAVIVATVRPGVVSQGTLPEELADADRWLELDEIATSSGVELLEWFLVLADGLSWPRMLVNAPPRW